MHHYMKYFPGRPLPTYNMLLKNSLYVYLPKRELSVKLQVDFTLELDVPLSIELKLTWTIYYFYLE